jgi:molybdopterin-guanine dinucleotide biosynthesis protein B
MRVFGIAGWSGSGKTTLLVRLIPELTRRGLRVATVKHTHHDVRVGDASMRALAEAGAEQVLVASSRRFALLNEHPPNLPEPSLDQLCGQVRGIDLLLVEGFKGAPHPKIEVWDPALGKPLLAPTEPSILAIAADQPVSGGGWPRFARDDVTAIGAFIVHHLELPDCSSAESML